MYIEGDSATYGDMARLLSAECADPQPQCLQFWYHMHGSSWTMGLSVHILQGNVGKEVWKMNEDHGDMWHLAQVDLISDVKFKVRKSEKYIIFFKINLIIRANLLIYVIVQSGDL